MKWIRCRLLLPLLAAFVYQAKANKLTAQCIKKEDDSSVCGQFQKSDCPKVQNLPQNCPNLCDNCPHYAVVSKTKMKKVDCADWERNGQVQAACWEADYMNGNGKQVVYFYPDEDVSGADGFHGYVRDDANTMFYALGNVRDASAPITFRVNSDKTDDSGVEVNADSSKVPVSPDMYVSTSTGDAEGVLKKMMEDDPKLAASLAKRDLNLRAALPDIGFKGIIQPVFDRKFMAEHGANSSALAKAVVKTAVPAFNHSTARVKFQFDVKDAIKFDKDLTADPAGFVRVISAIDGPSFNFLKVADNVTVILFITQTPIPQIGANFKLEFALEGNACQIKNIRVAIIENFGTSLIAAETAIRAIGNVLGYKADNLGSNGQSLIQRNSSNGMSCTMIGGFMDLPAGSNRWTNCSNEDITAAIMNNRLTCLPEIPLICPKDNSDVCPNLIRNNAQFCITLSSICPLSCATPICSKRALVSARSLF